MYIDLGCVFIDQVTYDTVSVCRLYHMVGTVPKYLARPELCVVPHPYLEEYKLLPSRAEHLHHFCGDTTFVVVYETVWDSPRVRDRACVWGGYLNLIDTCLDIVPNKIKVRVP